MVTWCSSSTEAQNIRATVKIMDGKPMLRVDIEFYVGLIVGPYMGSMYFWLAGNFERSSYQRSLDLVLLSWCGIVSCSLLKPYRDSAQDPDQTKALRTVAAGASVELSKLWSHIPDATTLSYTSYIDR